MKKKIYGIIGIVVILAAVFAYAHISKVNRIYDREIDASDYKDTSFYLNQQISQNFQANEKTIDAISVKCKVTGAVDQVVVKYALLDVEANQTVAEGEFKGNQFENSKFFEIPFETITGCEGKNYQFIIQTENEDMENHIDFCYVSEAEKNEELKAGDEQIEGTLVLKVITNRFDLETFCVLLLFVLYIAVFLKFLYKLFK